MQYLLTSKLSNEKVDMKRTIEVNRPSTKHLLNNFLGQFFRKALTFFGMRVKNGLFVKKGV